MKRALDVTLSSVGLVLSSPLLIVIWFLVRRDGGPLLYRSTRVGLNGAPFDLIKFRTMVVDADRIGPSSTANDDPRITRIGQRLRRYKLDELPQLFNVLIGEMSVVGPRPQVPKDVALYTDEERELLTVSPGITDWASIKFSNEGQILEGHVDADAAYNDLIRPEKSRLGLYYVRNRSFGSDVWIIVLTVVSLFRRDFALRRLPGVAI